MTLHEQAEAIIKRAEEELSALYHGKASLNPGVSGIPMDIMRRVRDETGKAPTAERGGFGEVWFAWGRPGFLLQLRSVPMAPYIPPAFPDEQASDAAQS